VSWAVSLGSGTSGGSSPRSSPSAAGWAVVTRAAPRLPIAMVSRSDLLAAHQQRLDASLRTEPGLASRRRWRR